MKGLNYIVLLGIILTFSFCKKKKDGNSTTPKTSKEAQAVSYMIRGNTWIWDSTVLYKSNTAVNCYTKDQLKTYTVGTTVITCTTVSTLSITLNNNPFNNTGDGTAYANTFEEYYYSWDQRMGQMQVTSVYKNSNDSLINLNETWGWIVGPNQAGTNIELYLKGNSTSLHKCTPSVGILSFGSATYLVQDVSANSLVYQQALTSSSNFDLAKYYFHR